MNQSDPRVDQSKSSLFEVLNSCQRRREAAGGRNPQEKIPFIPALSDVETATERGGVLFTHAEGCY